ncbi:hypothetical protein C9374_005422 [Naegleria lovaniensis]|uniref:BTB domain-containing protein n=1 Tax=Naegleria lovaniensis TaxID=51637 RepID=A0AA88KK33_NAELO|nr:uncharacterized protein C9374_005422 [Naegleria lovaniensis]KAG2382220.1 hypothetical protein C9374_005422 [Naegleria lovaniensis]
MFVPTLQGSIGSNQQPVKKRHVLKQKPRQDIYACGQDFFIPMLSKEQNQSKLQENQFLCELTRIDGMDYVLDDAEDEIIKFETRYGSWQLVTRLGKVYGLGRNTAFVLGLRDCNPKPIPVFNSDLWNEHDKVTDCSLGFQHCLFLTESGKVFACGTSEYGEIPIHDTNFQKNDFEIHSSKKKQARSTASTEMTRSFEYPQLINPSYFDSPIVKIFAFPFQSYFVSTTRKVYACGNMNSNSNGSIPHLIPEQKIKTFQDHFSCIQQLKVSDHSWFDITNTGQISAGGDLSYYFNDGSTMMITHLEHPYQPIDLYCSNTHYMIKTNERTLQAGGQNTCGELGIGHSQSIPYGVRFSSVKLPFEWKEQDEVKVFLGHSCTVVIHIPNCEENKEEFPYIEDLVVSRILGMTNECEQRIFEPLLEKISPNIHTFLKREEFMKLLNPQEIEWTYTFVKMFMVKGYQVVSRYEVVDLFTKHFCPYLGNTQFYIFLMFFLNDVCDIGEIFKKYCFETLSEMINTYNVLDILKQISDYLATNILTNSKKSILMLTVKKCLAFLKLHWNNMKQQQLQDDRLIKLEKKIQASNKEFGAIGMDWREDSFMKEDVDTPELIASLFNDATTSDLKLSISNDSHEIIHVHKHVISALSPVLKVLYESDRFSDTSSSNDASFDIYGFVKDESDSEEQQELKKTALLMTLKACYSKFEDISSSPQISVDLLCQTIMTSLQFQMDWLTQFCCQILLKHVTPNNYKSLLVFASQLDDMESCKLLIEHLITYGLKYVPFELTSLCKDLPPHLSSRLITLFENLFRKGVVKNGNLSAVQLPVEEQDLYLRAVMFHN